MLQIFVISLESASDRRRSVRAQFRAAGLPFRFFDAIDGSRELDAGFEGIDEAVYRLNTYRDPLPGEIGCYASHVSLWRHCVELGEPIVVLEDDCRLEGHFAEALGVVGSLIQEFGFIRLQGFGRSVGFKSALKSRVLGSVRGHSLHYLSSVPLCLLGYAVSPSCAARLVAASRRIESPIDKFVQRTWEHGEPIFALSPACVSDSALAADTTIGVRKTNKKGQVALALRRAGYKIRGEIARRRFDRRQLGRLRLGSGTAACELPEFSG